MSIKILNHGGVLWRIFRILTLEGKKFRKIMLFGGKFDWFCITIWNLTFSVYCRVEKWMAGVLAGASIKCRRMNAINMYARLFELQKMTDEIPADFFWTRIFITCYNKNKILQCSIWCPPGSAFRPAMKNKSNHFKFLGTEIAKFPIKRWALWWLAS